MTGPSPIDDPRLRFDDFDNSDLFAKDRKSVV